MRQVNGWGFKRITRGPDRNSYYHELFVRDNPELAWTMSRRGSSSSKGGKNDEADKEPNFYEMTGLTSSSNSIGQGANSSSSGLYNSNTATAQQGYDFHEGHGPLYGGGGDPSGPSFMGNPHHYPSPQSLMSERPPHFNPIMRLPGPQGSAHPPDDYSSFPPNSGFPPNMPGPWSSLYPNSSIDYPPNYYNHYGGGGGGGGGGKPSSHFFPQGGPPEDPSLSGAGQPGSSSAHMSSWSEEGQHFSGGQRPPPPQSSFPPPHPDATESSHPNDDTQDSQQSRQGKDWYRGEGDPNNPRSRFQGDQR